MQSNLFDKKYLGDSRYVNGWTVAVENFNQHQNESGKKRRWSNRLRDWWKNL